MKIRFLKAARDELQIAFQYYKGQEPRVGTLFLDEVKAAIHRVRQMPNFWHPLSEHIRRCLLRRFPYGIIYQLREDEI